MAIFESTMVREEVFQLLDVYGPTAAYYRGHFDRLARQLTDEGEPLKRTWSDIMDCVEEWFIARNIPVRVQFISSRRSD